MSDRGEDRRSAEARVEYAKGELRDALAALEAVTTAEFDARDAALFAEAQATGDLSKLPRCEFFDVLGGEEEPPRPSGCERIATRSGGCEAFYICDEHKCRHACPELPWAAIVRAVGARAA